MKTTMKKVLSMALALVLLLGVLPFQALATEHTHQWIDSGNGTSHVCQVDGCTVTEAHTATTWGSDGDCHWQICTVCNATFNVDLHRGGVATCTEKGKCTTCGREYIDALTHDDTGAAATCTTPKTCKRTGCGAVLEAALNHLPGAAADCTTDQVCSRTGCGAVIQVKLGHTASTSTWQSDDDSHFYTCSRCTHEFSDTAHTWNINNPTCTRDKVCVTCGKVGATATGHDWNDATCLVAKTCKDCGTTDGNPLGHNWTTNGTCTRCTATTSSVTNYTITFDPNYDVTPGTTVTVPYGTKLYNIYTPTRVGHTFQGWYYDKGFGSAVPTDAIATESRTLYAKWKPNAPYPVSVVVYGNGNTTTPMATLDLYSWALDGEITLTDVKQAVSAAGIKANNNHGLSVYGPYSPNEWVTYMGNNYYKNNEKAAVKTNEPTVLYSMVHNVKITKGTTDPYGAIADKTNPKTGDMIFAPMMVLGLSASALAVLYYLNKKRAF